MVESIGRLERPIADLVVALPEKYQPIYGHPELSEGCSRGCVDRLPLIVDVASRLRGELGREVRVLDLGSAQGFFSLNLAANGATVVGVDYLQQNVDLCVGLVGESGLAGVRFIHDSIENFVGELRPEQFDLVLGLSVFHHIVHLAGVERTLELIEKIAACIPVGIYELAVREEPMYWAASQPERASQLLTPYPFVRRLGERGTHLSGITRPLFFASTRYWMIGDDFRHFDGVRAESHDNAMGSHQGTRRYFFSNGLMLKKMSLECDALRKANLLEYENEVGYLTGVGKQLGAPALTVHLRDQTDVWLLRQMMPGQLLSEMMDQHIPYSYEQVLDQLIGQLVALENVGLHHNDVRSWNIIIGPSGEVGLIDYGAISSAPIDCVWPDHLLLAFLITMREIVHGNVMRPYPVRRPLLDISMLPAKYRLAFFDVLTRPRSEWSFKALESALRSPNPAKDSPSWAMVLGKAEQALLQYEDALGRARSESDDVGRRLAESLSNAHAWYLRANDAERLTAEYKGRVGDHGDEARALELQLEELAGRCESINEDLKLKHVEVETTLAELQVARLERTAAIGELDTLRGELAGVQSELNGARAEFAECLKELAGTREELEKSGSDLHKASSDLGAARNELAATHTNLASMTANIDSLRDELGGVRAGLLVAQQGLRITEHDLAAARSELKRTSEQLEVVTRGELEDVRRELEGVRLELTESLANAHRWFVRAVEVQHDLGEVYSSRSWRWTRPLRFAVWSAKHPAQSLRRVLAGLMRRLIARPRLAGVVNAVLKIFPGVHRRLRTFALNRQIVAEFEPASQIPSGSGPGRAAVFEAESLQEELMKLSRRGRGIHERLQAARGRGGN